MVVVYLLVKYPLSVHDCSIHVSVVVSTGQSRSIRWTQVLRRNERTSNAVHQLRSPVGGPQVLHFGFWNFFPDAEQSPSRGQRHSSTFLSGTSRMEQKIQPARHENLFAADLYQLEMPCCMFHDRYQQYHQAKDQYDHIW